MAIEVVDFPSYRMVDLSSSLCKRFNCHNITAGLVEWPLCLVR